MKRRAYTFLVVNAVLMGALAIIVSQALGYPLRDPDGFLGPAWVRLPMLCLGAFIADIVPRSLWRSRLRWRQFVPEARVLIREHWTRERVTLVLLGVVCFYVTYVSYRNLKNFLPFVRPMKYDYMLHDFDLWLFFGHDPALVLQGVLGTGISAHVLSFVYLLFLPLVPITVAVWAVWSRNISFGYWFITADCLAWSLGTLSYYILPTMGPNFAFPWLYGDIAQTPVADLQDALANGRENILLVDPFGDGVQSVAGFASLHVAITLMMALVAHYTVRHTVIRWVLWVNVGLTTLATSYFGWHYLADDFAGALIAVTAVYLGGLATGQKFDRAGRSSHPTTTTHDVPVELENV